VISKDEWRTKEGPGMSMKNVLYVQWHDKSTSQADSKPVTLVIVELRKSRMAVS